MKDGNNIHINRQWTILEMSPEEYAKLVGHSEGYVRQHLLPEKIRNEKSAKLRIRIGTSDILEDIHDIKGLTKED